MSAQQEIFAIKAAAIALFIHTKKIPRISRRYASTVGSNSFHLLKTVSYLACFGVVIICKTGGTTVEIASAILW